MEVVTIRGSLALTEGRQVNVDLRLREPAARDLLDRPGKMLPWVTGRIVTALRRAAHIEGALPLDRVRLSVPYHDHELERAVWILLGDLRMLG